MVESLMLIALGFMTATFIGILLSQFIWRRAVTVTTRRLQENPDQPAENVLPENGDTVALQAAQHELDTVKAELAGSQTTIGSLQSAAQDETAQKGDLAQEIDRVTKELSQSEDKVEQAKSALSEAETKILSLSSDAAAQEKEVSELTQALNASKQETETAETGRVKAEGILTNVSAAAAALVATLPQEPDQIQITDQEEAEKADTAPTATETPETDDGPKEVASEKTEQPEASPVLDASEVSETPDTDLQSDEGHSALVAAIPTLDEFAATEEGHEDPNDADQASIDEASLATASTLDARIEALKEGVSSPA